MLKWKVFVKGQGLNEELLCFADRKVQRQPVLPHLDGEQVRRTYEEIINEPSTSSSGPGASRLQAKSGSSPSKKKKQSPKVDGGSELVVKKPKPTILQLMKICESNNYEKLVEEIGDFNINSQDEFGWTLLMCAACAGSYDCIEYLLKSGANLRLIDKSGQTALRLAQKKQKKDVCDLITNFAKSAGNQPAKESLELDEEDKAETSSNSEKYCDSCQANYSSERIHFKSIPHLVTTTDAAPGKTHYGIPESNKGFQLMLKTGWDKQAGLGSEGQGQKYPVKTVLKRDRQGLGNLKDRKAARITHFAAFDPAAVERPPDKRLRLERNATLDRKANLKQKSKEKRKEINFRRELSALDY